MLAQDRPIVLVSHPRACSTAFERLMLSHPDNITCFHELFDDAYYYGPERLGSRFMNDVQAIATSGKAKVRYLEELDQVERALSESQTDESSRAKRVFVKILARTVVPPNSDSAEIAPSLRSRHDQSFGQWSNIQNQSLNPTVLPFSVWHSFDLTFLVRDPRLSVPSVYRLAMPHMSPKTKRTFFLTEDVGWIQLRKFFDYAREVGLIGRHVQKNMNQTSSSPGEDKDTGCFCVIDAKDLLKNPTGTLKAYCAYVGLPFSEVMLKWDSPTNREKARDKFQAFEVFHEEALRSKTLESKDIDMDRYTDDDLQSAWKNEFGDEGARIVKENVDANMEHYFHMRQFALNLKTLDPS